jgi:S1-C subfamily serine protease
MSTIVDRLLNLFQLPRLLYSTVSDKKRYVYRVLVYSSQGLIGAGSGFFINEKQLLTCFHVVFGADLRNIRNDTQYQSASGPTQHAKLETFFHNKIVRIEVECPDGSRLTAVMNDFNETYDVALLDVNVTNHQINPCRLDTTSDLEVGDYLAFGGFAFCPGYVVDKYPFTFHEGMLSAFVSIIVGGDSYEHLQINSVNLGGNSGAPLFRINGARVIGIMNGNVIWGNEKVPLSIAFATSLKFLREKTTLLS